MTTRPDLLDESSVYRELRRAATRREFIIGTAALGASLSAASLLAACGPGTQTSSSGTSPKRGGTANVAMAAFDPKSFLDPARSETDFDAIADGMMYDSLVALDDGFQPLPALATSWDASPAGDVWTFHLRSGVEFHDGSPFTADDVAYTFNRIIAADSLSPIHAQLAGLLPASGVKVIDSHTIRLSLNQPNAFFLGTLVGGPNLRIVKNGETDFSKPIGTGAFKFAEYQPGQLFTATRNPNYWQSGLPYLDAVHFVSVPEQATKVQSVISGSAHIADAVDISTAKQLSGNTAVQLYSLPAASFNVIAFKADTAPFNDVRVLQAIKMATDRTKMFNAVLQGQGVIGADIPVRPNDPLFPSGFQPLAYDPEKAKSLLSAAGFSNGLPITLYTADAAAFMVETATAFQNVVKAANINVTIQQTPSSSFFSQFWLKKPAYTSFWFGGHSDVFIALATESNSPDNESVFKNAQYDQLVDAARQTSDVSKQKSLYAQAMPMLAQQSGWLIPYWGNRIWPAKTTLHGVKLDYNSNANFLKAWIS